jgi:hypothetical protein
VLLLLASRIDQDGIASNASREAQRNSLIVTGEMN